MGERGYFFGCDYRESQRALSSAQLRNSPALGSLHRGLPANPVWPRPVGGVLLGLGALQFMLLVQFLSESGLTWLHVPSVHEGRGAVESKYLKGGAFGLRMWHLRWSSHSAERRARCTRTGGR